jgi:hypothetical protein
MESRCIGLGLAAALLCAAPAAAQANEQAERASIGFWGPADTFWRDAVELPPCSRADVRRNSLTVSTPRYRVASQERHAELLGEIVGPPRLVQLVIAQARSCVAAPGVSDTAPGLIANGAAGFSRFHSAFSACMAREGAAQHIGSMTLWIDNHCNW